MPDRANARTKGSQKTKNPPDLHTLVPSNRASRSGEAGYCEGAPGKQYFIKFDVLHLVN
jgi:hypothetical protein